MKLVTYMRVIYIGPNGVYDNVDEHSVGYIIENYGDGNYEVEFSGTDGITKAQCVIPEKYLQSAEN